MAVTQLQIIKVGDKKYYVDFPLLQIRNIYDPHDYVEFRTRLEMMDFVYDNENSEEELGAVKCPNCDGMMRYTFCDHCGWNLN